MDFGTRVFWGVLLTLTSASTFFGLNAEQARRVVSRGETGAALVDGDEVTLERVIDGDTLLVRSPQGSAVAVRLIGIKAFSQGLDRAGAVAQVGGQAVERVRALLTGNVARVQLNPTPKDSHGRFLAHLFVGGDNLAKRLLVEGLVLVYPAFPFEQSEAFFADQEEARAARRGLWKDPSLSLRADRLLSQWREQDQ